MLVKLARSPKSKRWNDSVRSIAQLFDLTARGAARLGTFDERMPFTGAQYKSLSQEGVFPGKRATTGEADDAIVTTRVSSS